MLTEKRNSLVIVIVYLLGLLVLSTAASSLEINPDNRVYYDSQNTHHLELKKFENEFQTYSNVTYLLESEREIGKAVSEQLLWVKARAQKLPGFIRSYSIENYPHISSSDDEIVVQTTLEAACKKTIDKCSFEGDEFYYLNEIERRLISTDLRAIALVAVLDIAVGDHRAVTSAAQKIKEIQLDFESNFPETSISHTGTIPMMQAFVDASQEDLTLLLPFSILVMLFLVFLTTGSVYYSFVLALTCLGSIIATMALANNFGLPLNSATSILPLALLIISTSSSIHLLTFISRRHKAANTEKNLLLIQTAVNANRAPIFLASLTTAFGFATLCIVEIPPFREFGFLGAIGVFANFLIVIYITPHFLALRNPNRGFLFQSFYSQLINQYAKFVDQNRLPTKTIMIACTIAAIGLLNIKFSENYVEFFDTSHEFRKGADRLNEALSSPYHLDLVVDFGTQGAVFDPKNLTDVLLFQNSVSKLENVSNTLSFAQHIERAKRSLAPTEGGDLSIQSKENMEQYYIAYLLSLSEGQSPTEFVDIRNSKARISLLLKNLSSSELRHLELSIRNIWEASFRDLGMLTITGEAMPLAHISLQSISDMTTGLLASLALLFFGTLALTKNLHLAIVTTMSVLAPFLMSFGLWSWFGAEFGLATTLIIAVTLGIIVDDTIHFIFRYRLGHSKLDLSVPAATGYAIHHAGLGILASSILLTCGFVILSLSSFTVNKYFGMGVSISIICALVFTLLALPTILSRAPIKVVS